MEGSIERDLEMESPVTNDVSIDIVVDTCSNLSISRESVAEELSCPNKQQLDLKEMQCPYTWTECLDRFDTMDWVGLLLVKLSKPKENAWCLYKLQLLLACVYGYQKKEAKALETFESCEKDINEKTQDLFFKDIIEGLHHVISASKAHMNFRNGKIEAANNIASDIKSVKDLSKKSQAAIWATKAYILCEFGNDVKSKALDCAKLAIELDPDDDGTRKGAWYYLAGKIHTQIRQIDPKNKMPGIEELRMFERSVKNSPFSVHIATLADKYKEAASVHLGRAYYNRRMSNQRYELCIEMYKKALAEEESNDSVSIRCGSELMKLPKKYRHLGKGNEHLKIALESAEENFNKLLLQGSPKDNSVVSEDSSKSSRNTALVNKAKAVIKINRLLNEAYNPVKDCSRIIAAVINSLPSKESTEIVAVFLLLKGEYFLYVKRNLLEAAKVWEKAIKTAPNSTSLLEYECQLVSKEGTVNIYEVLKKEIRKGLSLKNFNAENKRYLSKLLKICEEKDKNI